MDGNASAASIASALAVATLCVHRYPLFALHSCTAEGGLLLDFMHIHGYRVKCRDNVFV